MEACFASSLQGRKTQLTLNYKEQVKLNLKITVIFSAIPSAKPKFMSKESGNRIFLQNDFNYLLAIIPTKMSFLYADKISMAKRRKHCLVGNSFINLGGNSILKSISERCFLVCCAEFGWIFPIIINSSGTVVASLTLNRILQTN